MSAPCDLPIVEWGWAGAALEGEEESGDVHVVTPFPDGVLVAVIDGLGHGTEAAAAAHEAARVLEATAGQFIVTAIEECHRALQGTRGAVMTVAAFDARDSSMTWVGVGNVDAVLLRADPSCASRRESIALRGGVVGYQLPPLRPSRIAVRPGDTLIMVTDGIRSEFMVNPDAYGSPSTVANSILSRYSRGTDDALVVVARYEGPAS